MARSESKIIMGYLPIEERHHAAIVSLVAPATPETRMLDPFAGEGAFLEVAAKAWKVTPYANELDGERATACIKRFGPMQAVQCDVERLSASTEAFGILWANPPYDHDGAAQNTKRIELAYLRHSWKWAQDGAVILWCVYRHHITEEAATFFAKYSHSVDVWALPGKHLGEYDQVIVVAVKGMSDNPGALYQQIMTGKAAPRPLTVQPEPVYRVPRPPTTSRKFVFSPDMIDEHQGLRLIMEDGAWAMNGFQALLEVPARPKEIEPIVPPRPGHLALVLAAGIADGAVIPTQEYGAVAIRGKTHQIEKLVKVETEPLPADESQQITKTTTRLKPTTTLTLLAADGTMVEMNGDDALLKFITENKAALATYLSTKFKPIYRFNFNGLGNWLSQIRLKGKHGLYAAQRHVIGAVTEGFEHRDGILLVGSMGVGKTVLGSASAIAIATGVTGKLREQMRSDQVVLVVAPPHLMEKWRREILSISPNAYIEQLQRHEDVKGFMDKAAHLGKGIAKIGLIKRDMTKLGAPRETAVIWRTKYHALWEYGEPRPANHKEGEQRLEKHYFPTCPNCGATIFQHQKGESGYATEAWLKAGKRECEHCKTPLWQESRDQSAKPKPGEKYATKNPRYRLDKYLKLRYPDRVYLLIWDEAHECQNSDTGNGEAFARMAGVAHKTLAMTGTPFNGKSSSLFNLEYAINPRVRADYAWGGADRLVPKKPGDKTYGRYWADSGDDNQRGSAESRWVNDMGVMEQIVEERPYYNKDSGTYTGTSTYERPYQEAPGISPLLVAELLDHAIFFSLGDLGKWLPKYQEIALPVKMDADTGKLYDSTRDKLKKYLIDRRWEGDTTFRGAYLQWSMGWSNATFRPCQVIHNIKNPITGTKNPSVIADLPSFGEDRIYAKEQALIDIVKAELAENRPVVIFLRQTGTKDIQPRIEGLIRQHIAGAKPFTLKNTVDAERRERVIEMEVSKGTNSIISNPELVKTGLDLVFAPTLIFHEIVFNLGTMMQAAGRSYRLNQTHDLCKTYYLYHQGTMEENAIHLMSRKQRAAKLLTGEIGLSGLEALTEGEAGLEEALLNAIGKEEGLLDPAELFKVETAASEIDKEDAAYWDVEVPDLDVLPPSKLTIQPIPVPFISEPTLPGVLTQLTFGHVAPNKSLPPSGATVITDVKQDDPIVAMLKELGGIVSPIQTGPLPELIPSTPEKDNCVELNAAFDRAGQQIMSIIAQQSKNKRRRVSMSDTPDMTVPPRWKSAATQAALLPDVKPIRVILTDPAQLGASDQQPALVELQQLSLF